ncbi:MAG: helix-turn-helix transcriptional regulator [Nitrospinae bacterium]|nr:helix-turn-helix transcriptional regulator [Nitrospinota bacterium]
MKRDRYTGNEQHLRRILKQIRLAKGITQEDLAKRLKVPQSFVSKYESGERMLTFSETVSICRALDITLNSLLKDYLPHHDT